MKFEFPSSLHVATITSSDGKVGSFQTRAVASTAIIDDDITALHTSGFATAGDGGQALYYKVASEPALPGGFQSADGAWWDIVASEFNVRAFGAVGDGVADDRQAIQDALDRAIGLNIASQGTFKVLLQPGHYKITAPLEILYWTPGDPGTFAACTVTFGCDARGYVPGQKWTEIICDYNDRPAIIVQAVRSVDIYGFAIRGTANSGILPTWRELLDDNVNPWWSNLEGGVPSGARDLRHSPHCGIAVDPFRNTVAEASRYPGYEDYYAYAGQSSSSGITIERMSIGRFIVGVGLSLGTLQLGDNMKVNECNFYCNKVCIVQGQTQNRGNLFSHNHVQGCQVYVDCIRYGTGTAPLGTITGGTIVYVKWLILGSPTFDSGTVRDLYAEVIWSIGCFGYFNGGHSLLFERCHIKFIDDLDVTAGQPGTPAADWHFFTQSPVTFFGGYIGFNNNRVNRMSIWNNSGARILFDGNIMLDGVPQFSAPERAEFKSVRVRFEQGGLTFGISNYYNEPLTTVGTVRSTIPPGSIVVENTSDRRWRSVSSWDLAVVQSTAVTITVPAPADKLPAVFPTHFAQDGTAHFVCNPISNSKYMQVGDELATLTNWFGQSIEGGLESNVARTLANLIIGRIFSIDHTTGDVVMTRVPISFPTGSYLSLRHHRMPIAHPITVATTTSASNVLTNINPVVTTTNIWEFWPAHTEAALWATGTGYGVSARVNHGFKSYICTAAHTASGTTEPGVGATWATVWQGPLKQGERINGTGIPANARVMSTDAAANTITISHDCTASGVIEIYDAKFVLEEGSAASIPTGGVWARGTFMRNSAIGPKDASNMVLRGWICTASGSPGTWEPQYGSAVSPAT